MEAQVVLNEKQSTYGSPYGFYTVTLTPSNRTKDSVTVKCDVSAHLQYTNSFTGYKVTCGLYIGGEWTDFVIYNGGGIRYDDGTDNGKLWKGNAARTASTTVTVSGLSAAQTKITDIKFRSIRQNVGGPQLDATACADLTIDLYGGTGDINVDGVWKSALPWINVNGEWRTCIPWCNNNQTWRSFKKKIIPDFERDVLSVDDDGQGNVAITFADSATVEQDTNGNVNIVSNCIEKDAYGNVTIL